MEHNHNYQNNILTAIFLIIAFVSNILSKAIENYDILFKVLSLCAVLLGIIINLEKAIKILRSYFLFFIRYFKKK